jgi:hypothetical protein
MRKNGAAACYHRHVLSGFGRIGDLPSRTNSAEFPVAHVVAFQHTIIFSVSGGNGIRHFRGFATPTASPRKTVHAFYCRRPKMTQCWLSRRFYGIKSLINDFSSFNSAIDASIFARLKSFIGSPSTISHFPARTRIGNEEINPFSTS